MHGGGVVVLPQVRDGVGVEDPTHSSIGQVSFHAVSRCDEDPSVLNGKCDNNPAVFTLPANAPLFTNSNRKVLDRLALERRYGHHHDGHTGLLEELLVESLQRLDMLRQENSGQVVDGPIPVRWKLNLPRRWRERPEQ